MKIWRKIAASLAFATATPAYADWAVQIDTDPLTKEDLAKATVYSNGGDAALIVRCDRLGRGSVFIQIKTADYIIMDQPYFLKYRFDDSPIEFASVGQKRNLFIPVNRWKNIILNGVLSRREFVTQFVDRSGQKHSFVFDLIGNDGALPIVINSCRDTVWLESGNAKPPP